MHAKSEHFDIIIVGGSLSGASLACALINPANTQKNQAFRIAVIDQSPLCNQSNQSSNQTNQHQQSQSQIQQNYLNARALALSHTSIEYLKTLKIWQALNFAASPIFSVHISKQNRWGITRITAAEQNLTELGFVVSMDALNDVLNAALIPTPNLKIFRPNHIIKLERQNQNIWSLTLDSNQTITARLLVAADGTHSYLKKTLGIDSNTKDYFQKALVVNLELNQSHQGIAFERFTDNGSIAFLPFGEKRAKCVWILPNAEIKPLESLEQCPDQELLEKIQNTFGYQLGRFEKLGTRTFYPLKAVHAQSLYDDGLVLIGNAANTLHPIAAQGFNLVLRDIAVLAEQLKLAQQLQQDIGSIKVLKNYLDLRKTDHERIKQFTNHLAEPHRWQWLGLLACEFLPMVKKAIAKRGLGIELG